MSVLPVVERSVEIKASPRTVWSLFASQEGLRRWVDPSLEIELTAGAPYRLCEAESGGWISGHVLEIVPEQRLVLSWSEEGSFVHPIRLSLTLEATPDGTRVTQRYDGFAGIGVPTWERAFRAYDAGIDRHHMLATLKQLAESLAAA